jgi:NADPH:quinone reductase-like Zn-dependent oxidoreductase
MGWYLVGKRVSFTNMEGAWAEYAIAPVNQCLVIEEGTTTHQGAYALVNPAMCLTLFESIKEKGHKAVVQTAACSALGKMINRYFSVNGIPVINIVRRKEQKEIIQKECDPKSIVLVSSDEDFETDLEKVIDQVHADCMIESVGGGLLTKVFRSLPDGSTAYLIGVLDDEKIKDIRIQDLIFGKKEITTFNPGMYFDKASIFAKMRLFYILKKNFTTTLRAKVVQEFEFSKFKEALEYARKHASEGKVVLVPSKSH